MAPRDYEQIPEIDCDDSHGPGFSTYRRRRGCSWFQVVGFVALAASIGAGILVVLLHRPSEAFQRQIQQVQSQVRISQDGEYSVQYSTTLSEGSTFVDLASRMLPPWYEASLLALDATLVPDTMKPSTVAHCRKTLLTTRNLLDAFSPVFPKHSLWAKLRKQYKDGYELLGYYQDLDHSGVEYDEELWQEREQDVWNWKTAFDAFQSQHSVRLFLYQQADPESCSRHESSHLFWDELMQLPCGHDFATDSLHRLGAVQIHHAKEYWNQVQNVTTTDILQEQNVALFHDLRKEVRIFLDEYALFGNVFLPDTYKAGLDTLEKVTKLLGRLHDDYTAYDIYVQKDSHPEEQEALAEKITSGWKDFMDWAISSDLEGTIQSILNLLEQ